MNHRFETASGDFSVLVSENFLKINDGREVHKWKVAPVEAVLDREPFGGEILFEDGHRLTYLQVKSELFLHFQGETWSFRRKEREVAFTHSTSPEIKSPMPGKIIQLFAEIGKTFAQGETILILEAMKMENAIKAPFACSVKEILHRVGEIVQQDESIVILDKIKT
ncbi:acetyl-CoA carboxylase biotin carboxyl carrier protein subunit [Leptospira ognonensis]|uniref:Acetyl-CoA carboxylase biotin carboxyl carrier protein subunit n=1 Tax=Leptospira ognonensis TaxID=2484945 RepID=A0A4R9K0H7_9LEPT|nr:acetyl-CoA carboxylase biotin carboxyl carrier protein subunit [Leptospira ognonensis]TGL59162.1 acetyl-CoA carboxylase biotin carboxyl carrier protein subunit [Leptospira ognonensis]